MMFCRLFLLRLFICSKQTPPPLLDLHKWQHGIALPGLANTTSPSPFGLIWAFVSWLWAGFCGEVCKTFSSWQWVQRADPVWPTLKTEVSSQKGEEQQQRGRFLCSLLVPVGLPSWSQKAAHLCGDNSSSCTGWILCT